MFLKRECCSTLFSTALRRSGIFKFNAGTSNFFHATTSRLLELRPAKWGHLDLPIHGRVAIPHKKLRGALEASRKEIPEDFYRKLDETLRKIRKQNWHEFNMYGLGPETCGWLQGMLEELISFENRLPESKITPQF